MIELGAGHGERQGHHQPGAERHRHGPDHRRGPTRRRAGTGAALALLQARGSGDLRLRRKGPRHGVRPPARGHAPRDVGRPARPQFRRAAAADQRRRVEAPAGTALDRLAAQVPRPGQGQPDRPRSGTAAQGHHRRGRALPADGRHDRPDAGRQCLADRRPARGQEPRDPPRDVGDQPDGEPADPRQLRPVPAERHAARRGGRGARQGAARPAWAVRATEDEADRHAHAPRPPPHAGPARTPARTGARTPGRKASRSRRRRPAPQDAAAPAPSPAQTPRAAPPRRPPRRRHAPRPRPKPKPQAGPTRTRARPGNGPPPRRSK